MKRIIQTAICLFGIFSVLPVAGYHHAPDSNLLEDDHSLHIPEHRSKTKSYATVKLKILDTSFLCREDDCTHHHKGCYLKIDYQLLANNLPDQKLGASVSCRVKLSYQTSHGYQLQSEQCEKSICHRLPDHQGTTGSVKVEFVFSRYEEVVFAHVDAIECGIDNIEPM